MPSTIRDVAREAGVSIATVSRAMRDSTSVRPDTRDRVMAAARDLEYTPSQLGRQLAERRYAANGIVFPDLSGPYYAEVVMGYEDVAAELRRSVLILSTHGRADADAAVRDMAGRCDGLVVLQRTISDDVVEQLAARGTRIVLVARPPVGDLATVNAENAGSARALGEHLVAGGARRIAFVGDPAASPDVAERWQGLGDAATAAGADLPAGAVRRAQRGGGRRRGASPCSRPATCPTPSPAPTTSSPSGCSASCVPGASTCPAGSRSPAGTT